MSTRSRSVALAAAGGLVAAGLAACADRSRSGTSVESVRSVESALPVPSGTRPATTPTLTPSPLVDAAGIAAVLEAADQALDQAEEAMAGDE